MEAVQTDTGGGSMPRHVAIIMDGNGRWAKARQLPRIAGHRQGAEAVRKTVEACIDLGIQYLTLYAFSSENWSRPVDEVDALMGLLRVYIRQEVDELRSQGVRLNFIGDREPLPADIRGMVEGAEEVTRANQRLVLTIALNYGGHAEIVQAVRQIAADAKADKLDPAEINEKLIESHLYTRDLPAPDLLIRTSGEMRLSNFLLWQLAYAEFVFLDCLWPDFDREALIGALSEYQTRERRYGAH